MPTHVLGRSDTRVEAANGPVGSLGRYRARDGSYGADVAVDLDRPHAVLVVGKRGYGKSYTLGVLAEECARTPGVAPVVIDPLGALRGLGAWGRVVSNPAVCASAIPPQSWPELVGLDPTAPAGALVWQAAAAADTLSGMREHVERAEGEPGAKRAATNHLGLAQTWEVFSPTGLDAAALVADGVTVLDCAGLPPSARDAVTFAVARAVYEARVADDLDCLPWLFVDEAHVAFDGVAGAALETLLTRGRAPGVSLVCATQRPGALPPVAPSQADLLVAHRLTAESDVSALRACESTYVDGNLRERLPTERGEALVVDDCTESVHVVRVRERETEHRGASPRASSL
ncbi:ATP-binding protein [Salinigranum halophilum]|uniref:ATP-binding protein n=1 Tax=Salinigranum halophilum TaxID=2565931 RepID=UPI0010A8F409|nr:ATP-binding protein [Salinigranum halophilum]